MSAILSAPGIWLLVLLAAAVFILPTFRSASGRRKTLSRWALLGIAAAAGYFLVARHAAHVYGILPYLLLAACPLLHLFHRGSHGRKPDSGDADGSGNAHHR